MTETRFLAPPEEPGEIGRLGLYRVRRVLRRGDMGVVFEAADPQAHRAVALHVLLPEFAADAEAGQRLYRCAQAMASLNHAHIAAILEVGKWNQLPYLVMALPPGEMLQDRLTREGRLPLLDVLRFGWEIAEALAAIHERRLTHGNLTAGNVWLESAERSTPATPRDRAGGKPLTLGTTSDGPATTNDHVRLLDVAMTGSTADWRDDLFALGWLLYRMSTGVAPFANVTVPAIVRTAELPRPKPPAEIDNGIPLEVSQLILDLLPSDAASQVPSAVVVARRLRELHDLLTWRGVAPRRYAVEDGDDPGGTLSPRRGSKGCAIVASAALRPDRERRHSRVLRGPIRSASA